MLLAANAFSDKGETDEQQHEPEPDDPPQKQQQADAWSAIAAFQREQERRGDLDDVFHLWREHEPALRLFRAVEMQFRRSAEGLPTGLDYGGVRAHPAFRAIPRDQREQVLADVATMESAWINERVRLYLDDVKRRKAFSD